MLPSMDSWRIDALVRDDRVSRTGSESSWNSRSQWVGTPEAARRDNASRSDMAILSC